MIVFLIAIFGLSAYVVYQEHKDYAPRQYVGAAISGALAGALLGVILSFGIGQLRVATFNEMVSHELLVLGDSLTVEGNNPLTLEYKNNSAELAYYRCDEFGSIHRINISNALADIHYSDTVTVPRIDVHIRAMGDFTQTWVWDARNVGDQRYDIYLPTGTEIPAIRQKNIGYSD